MYRIESERRTEQATVEKVVSEQINLPLLEFEVYEQTVTLLVNGDNCNVEVTLGYKVVDNQRVSFWLKDTANTEREITSQSQLRELIC